MKDLLFKKFVSNIMAILGLFPIFNNYAVANPPAPKIKVVLIGETGAGKTSFLRRLNGNPPPFSDSPKVLKKQNKKVNKGGRETILEIYDTSGKEEFLPSSLEQMLDSKVVAVFLKPKKFCELAGDYAVENCKSLVDYWAYECKSINPGAKTVFVLSDFGSLYFEGGERFFKENYSEQTIYTLDLSLDPNETNGCNALLQRIADLAIPDVMPDTIIQPDVLQNGNTEDSESSDRFDFWENRYFIGAGIFVASVFAAVAGGVLVKNQEANKKDYPKLRKRYFKLKSATT
ncbi:MAG: 50S ribosome-binding GTPase [Oscillospiraceae bacterium]|jgi:energy-coupling factor transporter ATP-binding protein EcfA2|nr:50S ribosome-binding GTPase [Oscillospiraceae bacterium]